MYFNIARVAYSMTGSATTTSVAVFTVHRLPVLLLCCTVMNCENTLISSIRCAANPSYIDVVMVTKIIMNFVSVKVTGF